MATYTGKTLYDCVVQTIPSGTHTFTTTLNETVSIDVEVYNFDSDVTYSTNPVLGDAVADTKMLVLKYAGNLTISSGVIITPQVRKKGMLIYVQGSITNLGTVSMTARGAIASGQNVYLFANEYIPATGGAGGARRTVSASAGNGNTGAAGSLRGSGGGGSGGAIAGVNQTANGGLGATGTSYSGGSGGGGVFDLYNGSPNNLFGGDGAANGGAGGNGAGDNAQGASTNTVSAGGGAGNPGGSSYGGYTGTSAGSTGTGGLLILYCKNSLSNSGSIQSNGSSGGNALGGGSGGGSVNIFTKTITNTGTITATGGAAGGTYTTAYGTVGGGAGGAGSVSTNLTALYIPNTITSIDNLMNTLDMIECNYIVPISGNQSQLFNIGIKDTTYSSTNFIYVGNDNLGRKILVSDRNIQTSISWDTLNQTGITSYTGMVINDITLPTISAYDFNETGGTVLYSRTTPALNGTITGTTVVSGHSGNARSFNGTSDRINFPTAVIPTGSKTIRFKMKRNGIPSVYERILCNGMLNTDNNLHICLGKSGDAIPGGIYYFVTQVTTNKVLLTDSTNVCDNQWHDVMFVQDEFNKTISYYLDGVLKKSIVYQSGQTDTLSYSKNLVVGCSYATATTYQEFFTGQIDSLEIYKGVITSDYSALNVNPNYRFILRTLTGGISSTDTSDEWDKYIATNTFGDKIVAGDSLIWNWSTPSWTSSTNTTNTSRVVRGGATVSTYAQVASSTATTGYGFRPVLIVEEVPKKYLFEDNNKLKKYDATLGWVEVGDSPATSTLMSQGMSNLSLITDTVLRQLTSTNPKVILMGEFSAVNSKVTALPPNKLIVMNTDINVDTATSIDSFTLSNTLSGAGDVKIIASSTSGETWGTFNGTSWVAIDHTDLTAVKANGITPTVFNAINPSQWYALTGAQRKIRFAFYLEVNSSTDLALLDSLGNQLDLQASWRIAKPGTDFDYEYPNATTLRIKIFANGDYKINY